MLEAKFPDGWLQETGRLAVKQTEIVDAVLHPCVDEDLLDQIIKLIEERAATIAQLEAAQSHETERAG